MTQAPLTLNDVAITTPPGAKPTYSIHGCIVDEAGNIHTLLYRWMHGVVTALLYPHLMAGKNLEPLVQPAEEVDVFAFQRFEHDVAHELPIVRIATSQLTGATFISKGSCPVTDIQLESIRLALKEMGLTGRDTLTGEEGDMTIAEHLEAMRQARFAAEDTPEEPEHNFIAVKGVAQ